MRREGQTRASEQLAAQCVNLMLTALRGYLQPDDFHRFKDEVWPDLLTVVESMTANGQVPQNGRNAEAVPEHQHDSAPGVVPSVPGQAAPGTQVAQPAPDASTTAPVADPPMRPPFPWERPLGEARAQER
jgi:hypothetical protein